MGAGRGESQAATYYQHDLGQGITLSLKFFAPPPRMETLAAWKTILKAFM